jgi:hypothetical protein
VVCSNERPSLQGSKEHRIQPETGQKLLHDDRKDCTVSLAAAGNHKRRKAVLPRRPQQRVYDSRRKPKERG